MLRVRAIGFCAVLILLVSCVGGCVQGDSRSDEEKDPHFQRGLALTSSQDFKGAAVEFERALETNPQSAAAHFQAGGLYDSKLNDFAAAIYHYERFLELQPNSKEAPEVRERIRGCKEQLANTEFPLPNSKNLQKEVDRLTAENQSLKQQLDQLKKQAATGAAAPAPVPAEPARYAVATPVATRTAASPSHPRVHIVRAHDTIFSIAAEYGIRSSAILAANPQIDPRRLRVGQSLNLP